MSEQQTEVPPSGAEGATTVADAGQQQQSAEESWFKPDAWRDGIAAGDETLAKIAKDFSDPTHLLRSHHKLQQEKSDLARRAAMAKPSDKATEEEVAKYREANGIPNSPEEYLKGYDIPEPIAGEEEGLKVFTELFHKHNLPAPAAQELMSTMADIRLAEMQGAFGAADKHFDTFMDERIQEVGSRTDAETLIQAENQFVVEAVGEDVVARESEYLAFDPKTGQWVGFVGNLKILRGSITAAARDQLGDTMGAPAGPPDQVISQIQPRYNELQAKYMESINSGGPSLTAEESAEKSRLAKQLSAQERRAAKRG